MLYTSLYCENCQNDLILLSEQLLNTKGYLVCPYCSSRHITVNKGADNLKELREHDSYKRVHGYLRQR